MTAFETIVGRWVDIDSAPRFPFDRKEVTTLVAIIKTAFYSSVNAFFANRLRQASPRDNHLAIGILLNRRHAVALLDLDR